MEAMNFGWKAVRQRMMDRPSYAIREIVAAPESKGTA
jgi:hypothetical protein